MSIPTNARSQILFIHSQACTWLDNLTNEKLKLLNKSITSTIKKIDYILGEAVFSKLKNDFIALKKDLTELKTKLSTSQIDTLRKNVTDLSSRVQMLTSQAFLSNSPPGTSPISLSEASTVRRLPSPVLENNPDITDEIARTWEHGENEGASMTGLPTPFDSQSFLNSLRTIGVPAQAWSAKTMDEETWKALLEGQIFDQLEPAFINECQAGNRQAAERMRADLLKEMREAGNQEGVKRVSSFRVSESAFTPLSAQATSKSSAATVSSAVASAALPAPAVGARKTAASVPYQATNETVRKSSQSFAAAQASAAVAAAAHIAGTRKEGSAVESHTKTSRKAKELNFFDLNAKVAARLTRSPDYRSVTQTKLPSDTATFDWAALDAPAPARVSSAQPILARAKGIDDHTRKVWDEVMKEGNYPTAEIVLDSIEPGPSRDTFITELALKLNLLGKQEHAFLIAERMHNLDTKKQLIERINPEFQKSVKAAVRSGDAKKKESPEAQFKKISSESLQQAVRQHVSSGDLTAAINAAEQISSTHDRDDAIDVIILDGYLKNHDFSGALRVARGLSSSRHQEMSALIRRTLVEEENRAKQSNLPVASVASSSEVRLTMDERINRLIQDIVSAETQASAIVDPREQAKALAKISAVLLQGHSSIATRVEQLAKKSSKS